MSITKTNWLVYFCKYIYSLLKKERLFRFFFINQEFENQQIIYME